SPAAALPRLLTCSSRAPFDLARRHHDGFADVNASLVSQPQRTGDEEEQREELLESGGDDGTIEEDLILLLAHLADQILSVAIAKDARGRVRSGEPYDRPL